MDSIISIYGRRTPKMGIDSVHHIIDDIYVKPFNWKRFSLVFLLTSWGGTVDFDRFKLVLRYPQEEQYCRLISKSLFKDLNISPLMVDQDNIIINLESVDEVKTQIWNDVVGLKRSYVISYSRAGGVKGCSYMFLAARRFMMDCLLSTSDSLTDKVYYIAYNEAKALIERQMKIWRRFSRNPSGNKMETIYYECEWSFCQNTVLDETLFVEMKYIHNNFSYLTIDD